MKKSYVTLLSLILLFSTIAGMQFVNFAGANFFPGFHLPVEPVRDWPTITVDSPSPKQYNDSVVLLSFTVNKPKSWVNPLYGDLTFIVGRVISYHYVLDGIKSQSFPVDETFHLDTLNFNRTLSLSQNLTIANGPHKIAIGLECETIYRAQSGEGFVPIQASSEEISFTNTGSFAATPLVATLALAASVIVVAGLLFYLLNKR